MKLPDPNEPPPGPYDQDDELELGDGRAGLYATFVVIVLAMVGLALIIAAVLRALS